MDTSPESVVLDREQIVAYATTFDPQPQHLDEARAAATPFGTLVASGWQTAALSMRLAAGCPGWRGGPYRIDSLQWQRPVRPGDRLSAALAVDGDAFTIETLDGEGRTVQSIAGHFGPA